MTLMTRILSAALAFVCSAAITGIAQAATSIKTSTQLVRNHDQIIVFFDHFVEPLNKAKGPVTINYIGGPETTPSAKQGSAMQRGIVDMIFGPTSYYGGQVPEARVVALSNQSASQLRKNGGMDILQKAFAEKINGHILAWPYFEGSNFYMFLSFKPKLSEKTGVDLSGIPMRSNATYKATLQAMHAIPVTVAPGDIYTGMQRGVIKGVIYPEGGITAAGWHEYVDYRIEPGFWRSTTMLVINNDKWKSLTKAERDFMTRMALKFEQESNAAIRKRGDIDNAKIFKSGVKHLPLEGKVREAYLKTVYGASWEDAKSYKNLTAPLEEIKAKLYVPEAGGS